MSQFSHYKINSLMLNNKVNCTEQVAFKLYKVLQRIIRYDGKSSLLYSGGHFEYGNLILFEKKCHPIFRKRTGTSTLSKYCNSIERNLVLHVVMKLLCMLIM